MEVVELGFDSTSWRDVKSDGLLVISSDIVEQLLLKLNVG
jgi:hypothetical protein